MAHVWLACLTYVVKNVLEVGRGQRKPSELQTRPRAEAREGAQHLSQTYRQYLQLSLTFCSLSLSLSLSLSRSLSLSLFRSLSLSLSLGLVPFSGTCLQSGTSAVLFATSSKTSPDELAGKGKKHHELKR